MVAIDMRDGNYNTSSVTHRLLHISVVLMISTGVKDDLLLNVLQRPSDRKRVGTIQEQRSRQ
jgi:hypothetical protein